jgi:hypothetical protein
LLVGEYSYIAAASIGIRATQSQLAMSTRSGRQSDTAPTPQQQHEVLNEVLEQLRSLNQKTDVTNQRVDRIWIHVFDKPECSGEKRKEERDHDVSLLHQSSFHGPRFTQHTPTRDSGYHY